MVTVRTVNNVLHSKSTLHRLFVLQYIHYLIGIVAFLAFLEVICVRKTNIKLFARVMRRIQCNLVRRTLFLVSQMLLLLVHFSHFCLLFMFNRLFWHNKKSYLKLHWYPLYWYFLGDQQTMHQRLPVRSKTRLKHCTKLKDSYFKNDISRNFNC